MSLESQREKLAEEVQKLVASETKSETPQEPTEVTQDVAHEPITESHENNLPVLSETEHKAYAMGWRPKGDYTGSHFVDAEEYVRRAPLFERIDRQGKELNELRDVMKKTTEHLTTTAKAAYEQAIRDLEVRKVRAVEIGDVDAFRNIENQTVDLRSSMQKDPLVNMPVIHSSAPVNDIHPAVKAFMNKHKDWYGVDKDMTADANDISELAARRARQNGVELTPDQELKIVEEKLQILYPQKFKNLNKSNPPTVGRSTSSGDTGRIGGLASQMTSEQRKLGEYFVKSNPKYTLELYAKDLQLTGRLGKGK